MHLNFKRPFKSEIHKFLKRTCAIMLERSATLPQVTHMAAMRLTHTKLRHKLGHRSYTEYLIPSDTVIVLD